MVKKLLGLVLVLLLLCSLFACSADSNHPAETLTPSTQSSGMPATSTVEPEQSAVVPIDYAVFCGNYSDTETVEGPCYTVSILNVDHATRKIEISISYVGINSSPVYGTEPILASIADDNTVQFEWTDSWMNQGVGTLVLDPNDPSIVKLLMTVTEEAEINRATLSTHDQYKTLIRRAD